jgi:hypothetical protein
MWLFSACKKVDEPKPQNRAIVLISDNIDGFFFKSQNVLIAYKNEKDSICIQNLKLSNYSSLALPGDSLEIYLSSKKLKTGKLLKYPYKVENRFFYTLTDGEETFRAFFDNSILIITTFDTWGNQTSMDYFTYRFEAPSLIQIYSLEDSYHPTFSIEGELGMDSLLVIGNEKAVWKIAAFPKKLNFK